MICPKCYREYPEGSSKCSNCGEDLVNNSYVQLRNQKKKCFFKLGNTTAQEAISLLFYIGLLPVLYFSIVFGKYLYLTNMYSKDIWFTKNGQKFYTSEQVNNLPLGIFGGLVFIIVTTIAWKVLCELLIIIFRAIETYTQKNKMGIK